MAPSVRAWMGARLFATLCAVMLLSGAFQQDAHIARVLGGALVAAALVGALIVARSRHVAVAATTLTQQHAHAVGVPAIEVRQSDPGVPGRPRVRAPDTLSAT